MTAFLFGIVCYVVGVLSIKLSAKLLADKNLRWEQALLMLPAYAVLYGVSLRILNFFQLSGIKALIILGLLAIVSAPWIYAKITRTHFFKSVLIIILTIIIASTAVYAALEALAKIAPHAKVEILQSLNTLTIDKKALAAKIDIMASYKKHADALCACGIDQSCVLRERALIRDLYYQINDLNIEVTPQQREELAPLFKRIDDCMHGKSA